MDAGRIKTKKRNELMVYGAYTIRQARPYIRRTTCAHFDPAAAGTLEHPAGVGSDTVYGVEEEGLMSIPVDKTHLRWRAQR